MNIPKLTTIHRKNVRVVKMAEKWNTYLMIDHQSFSVCEQTTKKRAQWFGKMLAVSLQRLITEHSKNKTL